VTARAAGSPLRAGIIAAGQGSRLHTDSHTLKPLVPIAGRTLVERVLSSLAEAVPSEVVIIVNEASLAVRDHVTSRRWPFAIRWVVETTPSSMHSFLRVLEELAGGGDDGPFLLSTVDTIAAPGAFGSFAASSRELDADVALAVARPGDDLKPLLARMTPGTSRIEALGDTVSGPASAEAMAVGFPRRPTSLRPGSGGLRQGYGGLRQGYSGPPELQRRRNATDVRRPVPLLGDRGLQPGGDVWATAGYYSVRPSVLREATAARHDRLPALRAFFGRLLERGYRLHGVPVACAIDVDRPRDVKAAEAFLKQAGA
jgi:NDP-sugar pyrophosphorylase family protein